MQYKLFYIALFLVLISCQNQKTQPSPKLAPTKTKKAEISSFKNYFVYDSTLNKSDSTSRLITSDERRSKRLLAPCNCEKDVKNNSLKIQLRTGILADSIAEKYKNWFTSRMMGSFKGQLKYLIFYLKDDTVQKNQLYSKSTSMQYHNWDFKYAYISKYHIRISKFNYSIASNIFGTYKVILPEPFGFFKDDTVLTGTFQCNNGQIKTLQEIKKWNLNKDNKQQDILDLFHEHHITSASTGTRLAGFCWKFAF